MIVVVLGVATLIAYLYAVRAYDRRYPDRRFRSGRIAAFAAGVALGTLALVPPVDRIVDASFGAHMVQHLVLMLIVPPLILLGAPLLLLVATPPPETGRRIAHVTRHPFVLALASPVLAWLLFVATLWSVHFSPLYDLALDHVWIHVAEHALLLATAFLFWLPVVQVGYAPLAISFPVRMFYLFLAIPQGAFLGLAIYSSRYVLYPHYLAGRSLEAAMADQHNAGAVMWIAGGALLFLAFMLTAGAWAAHEYHEAPA
ncbi:MAG: cytochrome c oxidase assembly protein [Rhodanobacteraceae bacterium]